MNSLVEPPLGRLLGGILGGPAGNGGPLGTLVCA